ncbi:hypothetical protein KIPE111705_41315 [Kibdelosporangium persicum]
MQRDQRRRTGSVHRDRRPLQTECVRHPARDDRPGRAGHQVPLDPLRQAGRTGPVSVRGAADEHAGGTALHRPRIDTGPFERLPRGLQQQPLLRIGGERLTRAHPEERGIEVTSTVQEAAFEPESGPVEHPAAIAGKARDRVLAVGHQPPQLLRGLHAAREPAAHADDGHRFVGEGPHGRRLHRAGCATEQFVPEVLRHGTRGREVEHERRRQPQARGGRKIVAQFDGGQRVEAQIAEDPIRFDRLPVVVTQHRRGPAAHQFQQQPRTLRLGCGGKALPQLSGDALLPGCLGDPAHLRQFPQQRGLRRRSDPRETRPVDVHHHDGRLVAVQHLLQRGQRLLGSHTRDATPLQVHPGRVVRRHTGARPCAPGHRRGRQAS